MGKMKAVWSAIRVGGSCFTLATMLLCPGRINASGILFQFDTAFPSDPNPAGTGPWIDAYFQDVSSGTVLLTITNVQLAAGEFVGGAGNGANGGVFFNLNPSLNATNLIFTPNGSSGSFTAPTIATGTDGFQADGDGKYDIQFDFATANSGRFTGGDSVTYTITGISTLTAADFAYLSAPAGGSGPFYAAAHVQGLSGGNSTWIEPYQVTVIPVPEPAPVALLAMSIGLWGVRGYFRRFVQTDVSEGTTAKNQLKS